MDGCAYHHLSVGQLSHPHVLLLFRPVVANLTVESMMSIFVIMRDPVRGLETATIEGQLT